VVVRTYLRDSWNQYDLLAHSAEADSAGVQISSGVMLQSVPSVVSATTLSNVYFIQFFYHIVFGLLRPPDFFNRLTVRKKTG